MAQVDFSILGDLGNVYRDARIQANRQRTLAELGRGADVNETARALFAAGDVQGGLSLAQLGRSDRDFAFRQQEAQRAQTNADRAFQFQKEQAEAAARGFELREIDDGAGGKMLVRVRKAGGPAERLPVEGQDTTPQNPFLVGKPGTEGQQNARLYASRMLASEKVLRDVEQIGTSGIERIKSGISDTFGYNIRGPDYQKFDQARRDFVNATLRRESGAVISKEEFENANKQYFPMPGDNAATIEQKRKNRMEAIKGIAAAGGAGYRPDSVFDPGGNIVPNPAPQRGQTAPKAAGISKAEYDALPSGATYTAPDGSTRTKR